MYLFDPIFQYGRSLVKFQYEKMRRSLVNFSMGEHKLIISVWEGHQLIINLVTPGNPGNHVSSRPKLGIYIS